MEWGPSGARASYYGDGLTATPRFNDWPREMCRPNEEEARRAVRRRPVMRLQRARDWLVPAIAGSVLGMWTVTTIYFLEWGAGGFGDWLREMSVATGLGLGLGVASLIADVWLVKRSWRTLPVGKRSFWISFAGPFLAEFLWILDPWERGDLPGLFVLVCKLMLAAFTTRLLFGKMPA